MSISLLAAHPAPFRSCARALLSQLTPGRRALFRRSWNSLISSLRSIFSPGQINACWESIHSRRIARKTSQLFPTHPTTPMTLVCRALASDAAVVRTRPSQGEESLVHNPRAWRHSIEIQPGESLASIAVRLAPKGHVSVAELLEHGLKVESVPALIVDLRAIARLAELGSFDLDDLDMRAWTVENAGILWRGRELPESWVTPHKRRLAPGRLAADGSEPFHRRPWQLNVYECDLDTGERLIDICPRCQTELSWIDVISIVKCQACGFDLRKAAPTYVNAAAIETARRFEAYFCGDFDMPPPFDTMSFRSVCHAMEWLAYFRSILKGPILPQTASNALSGFEALEFWPSSFDLLVWSFFRRKLGLDPSEWPRADQAPAMELLQAIGEAKTRELHEELSDALVELLSRRHAAARPFIENAGQGHWIKVALRGRSPYLPGWALAKTKSGRRRRAP